MKDSLIQVLEEQSFLNFTGKVNVLEANKGMLLGSIYILEGDTINCSYHKYEGIEALESIFFLEFEGVDLNIIPEPEMIPSIQRKIHYPFTTLKKKIEATIQVGAIDQKDAPPPHVKLAINSDIMNNGQSLTSDEFDALKILCDYNKVEEIYRECRLAKHRVTSALVKLRKKKAIKVIK